MQRSRFLSSLLLGLLVLSLGPAACSGCGGPAAPAPDAGTSLGDGDGGILPHRTDGGPLASPAEPLVPELAASVNGSAEVEVGSGWPLVITCVALHPDAYASDARPALTLAAGWEDRLVVRLEDTSGQRVELPLVRGPVAGAGAPLILGGETGAALTWWTPLEGALVLEPGRYRLRVVLDTTEASDGETWRGRVASPPVLVSVMEDPQTPASQREWQLAVARHALSRGQVNEALAAVDAALTLDAGSPLLHTLRAQLLARTGALVEARRAYEEALRLHAQLTPGAPEPPAAVLRALRDLDVREAADGGP